MSNKTENRKVKFLRHRIEVKRALEVLLVFFFVIGALTFFYYIEPNITGLIVASEQFNYSDNVNLNINESSEYIWEMGNKGELRSVKVSGVIDNSGYARVYIKDDNSTYLIFDSNLLEEKGVLDRITGFAVKEEKEEENKSTNHPPIWQSDIDIFIINKSLNINLNEYFFDKDNDSLSYSFDIIDNLDILIDNSIMRMDNKNNIVGNITLSIYASDDEVSKKKNIVLVLLNITNETGINETIINETTENITNPIDIRLEYKAGTIYDVDDNGIETKTGVIDFSVEDSRFNFTTDENKLCTRWSTYSSEGEEETFVCYGNSDCCALVSLMPAREKWNEIFYSYYGLYGATLNNIISAQVIYADYNLSIEEPYAKIYYSDWASLNATYYTGAISFKDVCKETCLLYGFNKSSYKLIFEVNNTNLRIDSIKYTITKTLNITNTPPELSKNFSNITIDKNKAYAINLNEYFYDKEDALSYESYKADNISVSFEGNLAIIMADNNFTGIRYMYFKASDGYESAVSNVFKISVMEGIESKTAILNVRSYPIVNGNWTVRFETIGIGNLTIMAADDTTYSEEANDINVSVDDLRLLELRCGNNVLEPYYLVEVNKSENITNAGFDFITGNVVRNNREKVNSLIKITGNYLGVLKEMLDGNATIKIETTRAIIDGKELSKSEIKELKKKTNETLFQDYEEFAENLENNNLIRFFEILPVVYAQEEHNAVTINGNEYALLAKDKLIGNSYKIAGFFYEDYPCNNISYHTVKVLTPGIHNQKLGFGDISVNVTDEIIEKKLIITDASGGVISSIDNNGNMFLKGNVVENMVGLEPAPNSFIVQNSEGENVAYINSTGYLFLLGNVTENAEMLTNATNFEIRDSSDNLIAFFDSSGNLKLKGVLVENYSS